MNLTLQFATTSHSSFFTLFERKVMGAFHQRLGPVKLSFTGVLQPLNMSNKEFYKNAPILNLLLATLIFILLPSSYLMILNGYSLLVFMTLGSISVLILLMTSWSSNSKYALMGGLRGISQSISYEAVFSTLLLMVMATLCTYSIHTSSLKTSILLLLIFPIWFISMLGETHRAPFDFSEAESELVSGFNVEFSGATFAYLFLSEYIMLLFGCMLISMIFITGILDVKSFFLTCMVGLSISYLVVWVRITFCRYRYDMLMALAWKVLLPLVLSIFMLDFLII